MTGFTEYLTLSNGVRIPQLGLGTWESKGESTEQMIKWAIQEGYRHIDTAHYYGNEDAIGKAVKECGVPREELFITTKLWNADQGYDKTLDAFERSRAALGVDYVDLYLIHWPGFSKERYLETWRALEHLYAEKKVRAIGVSNFQQHHLEDIFAVCSVRPMVNQVEMHPLMQQEELRAFCSKHDVVVTAWRPLGKGVVLSTPDIVRLAEKRMRTPAQVILRWLLQLGIVAIPKSSHQERIGENCRVFDFELNDEEMEIMKGLNRGQRLGGDPDNFFPL